MALGSRLSALRLPSTWAWLPYVGAAAYALTTPTGMSVGLGMRESISLHASAGAATRGILDSASAGILIYTSTVELMAHDFVFVRLEIVLRMCFLCHLSLTKQDRTRAFTTAACLSRRSG